MMRSDIQFIQQPEIDVHHYERGDTAPDHGESAA